MPMLETVIREGPNLTVIIMGRGLRQMSPVERDLLRRVLHLYPQIQSPLKVYFDEVLMHEPTDTAEELLKVVLRVGQPIDFV